MADEVQKFKVDVDLERMVKLATHLDDISKAMVKVTSATQSYNKDGKFMEGVLKGLTESGNQVSISFEKVGRWITASDIKFQALKSTLAELSPAAKDAGSQIEQAFKGIEGYFNAKRQLTILNPFSEPNQVALKRDFDAWNEQYQADLASTEAKTNEAAFNIQRALGRILNPNFTPRDVLAEAQRDFDAWNEQYQETLREAETRADAARYHIQRALGNILNPTFNYQTTPHPGASPSLLEQDIDRPRLTDSQVQKGITEEIARQTTAYRNETAALRDLEKGFAQAGATGASAGERILITWQGMARLLEVQILHSIIGQIIGQMQIAISEAAKLNIKFAEIQTISQANQLSLNQWAEGVRNLSDKYGKELADVAEGTYQLISNQAAHGAEALQLMNKIMEFSLATVSSTAAATNLLSSAMNAYGLGVDQVDHISASFFKTIELGRVRAEEMGNSIGRILPLAHNLGISLDEVNASIATLTIQGIKYDEAFTLINALMVKLLKPTKDMQELFKQWGVSSGEAAIAAFGYAGVLKKMEDASQGSTTEIASMLTNIRAIRAAVGQTGSAFDTYIDNLDKIKNSTKDYNNAVSLVANSPGQQFSVELQKIKNLFTQDFGGTIVKQFNDISQSIGGAANAVKVLFPAVKLAGETFIVYYTATKTAAGAQLLFNSTLGYAVRDLYAASAAYLTAGASSEKYATAAAMARVSTGSAASSVLALINPVTLLAAAIAGLVAVYEYETTVEQRATAAREEAIASFLKSTEEQTKAEQALTEQGNADFKDSINSRISAFLQYTTEIKKYSDQQVDAQKEYLASFEDFTKASFESVVSSAQSQLDLIKQAVAQAKEGITASTNFVKTLDASISNTIFKTQLNNAATALDKMSLLESRAAELKQQIDALYSTGNASEARKKAEEFIQILTEESQVQGVAALKTLAIQAQEKKLTAELAAINREFESIKKPSRAAEQRHLDQVLRIQTAIAALEDRRKSVSVTGDNYSSELEGFQKYINQKEAIELASQKKILDEKQKEEIASSINLELRKAEIAKLASFTIYDKEGKLKYKSSAEADTDYRSHEQALVRLGLDPKGEAARTINSKRLEIEKEFNRQAVADKITQNQEALTIFKKQNEDLIDAETKKRGDAVQKAQDAQAKLAGAFGAYLHVGGEVLNQQGPGDLTTHIKNQIGNLTSSSQTEDAIKDLTSKIEEQKKHLGSIGDGKKLAIDAYLDIISSLRVLDQQQKAQEAATASVERLKQIELQVVQQINQIAPAAVEAQKSVKLSAEDMAKQLQNLINKTEELKRELNSLPPVSHPGGVSFVPNLITGDRQVIATSSSTHIGEIHIHGIPLTGVTNVDAVALGRELRRQIDKGQVQSLA